MRAPKSVVCAYMPSTSPSLYLVRSGPLLRFWGLFRQACIAAYEDNCFGIAKGAAYSGLLAFFPVLASIAAILARANAESVASVFSKFLFEVVPPGSEDLVRFQFATKVQQPDWLIVAATLLSLWAASGAMMSLMDGFQAAYRLPSGRPFLKQRGVAILLVFIVAIPAVGASILIVFGRRLESWVFDFLGLKGPGGHLTGWPAVFSVSLRYVIAFACVVLATGLLYYFGPNQKVRFRSVWPGAILATALW